MNEGKTQLSLERGGKFSKKTREVNLVSEFFRENMYSR